MKDILKPVRDVVAIHKDATAQAQPAATPAQFTRVCPVCFGGGRIQEMDRYGHFTHYVTRCLCCGGGGRLTFQQEDKQ